MSTNPLVDPDSIISQQNYGRDPHNPVSGIVTEGYGQGHDRIAGVPLTGWLNGIPLVSDSTALATGIVDTAKSVLDAVQNGGWPNPTGLVETIAGGVGLAGDVVGLAEDPLGTIVQWAVSWVLQHVVLFREALDLLAGNPGAIAGYANTWNNISTRLLQVGHEFSSSVDSGPGQWSGDAFTQYHAMAADLANSIVAMAGATKAYAVLVDGVGQLVALTRNLIANIIAIFIKSVLVDLPEAVLDVSATAAGIVASAGRVASDVADVLKGLDLFVNAALTILPSILTIFTGVAGAEKKWAGGH
jgi:uncharacterized protein YukE